MSPRRAGALLALTTALASAGLVSPAAATSGCATRDEYLEVKNGMTAAQVRRTLGTNGKRLFVNPGKQSNEGREYVVCGHPRSTGSFVQVQLNNYRAKGGPRRVVSKQMQVH